MDKNEMMKTDIFITEKGCIDFGECDDMSGQDTFREHPCIVYIESYEIIPNMNMGYDHEFVQCRVLCDDGTILDVRDEDEAKDIKKSMQKNNQGLRYHYADSTGNLKTTKTLVREDYWKEFQSFRKRGRSSFVILQMMSEKMNEV